jgi:hypothetical protein
VLKIVPAHPEGVPWLWRLCCIAIMLAGSKAKGGAAASKGDGQQQSAIDMIRSLIAHVK